MATLRKYQIKALKSEIVKKYKKKKEEIKSSEEFSVKQEELASDLVEDTEYGRLQSLKQQIEQLEADLNELKEQKKDLRKKAFKVLGRSQTYRVDVGDAIEEEAEKLALRECGFEMPSYNEIGNAIVVSDLSGSDDIIAAVMEKLEQDN